jgi:putative transposase
MDMQGCGKPVPGSTPYSEKCACHTTPCRCFEACSTLDRTWAADFFTEEVWTHVGLVTCYVLFFIHLGTRRVHVAGTTHNPNAIWIAQQARNFSMMLEDTGQEPAGQIIHDQDTTFVPMDTVLKSHGVRIVKTGIDAPRMNAFAERFVREARETLDNMIVFGERHLPHILQRIQRHHNLERPHQGISNAVPCGFDPPTVPARSAQVRCEESLGGLLKHYYAVSKAA